jgi:hypothetical protein
MIMIILSENAEDHQEEKVEEATLSSLSRFKPASQ